MTFEVEESAEESGLEEMDLQESSDEVPSIVESTVHNNPPPDITIKNCRPIVIA